MYFHRMIGTGSYTTSTTNMYNNHGFYLAHTRDVRLVLKGQGRMNRSSTAVVECHSDSATLQGMLCHMRSDRVQSVPENQSNRKKVSLDHPRICIQTSHKHQKRQVRITSTVKVIRACLFIMWSVLEGTQRVPPTCTTKTSRTVHCTP